MLEISSFIDVKENEITYVLPLSHSEITDAILKTPLYPVSWTDEHECYRSADDEEIKVTVKRLDSGVEVTFKSPESYDEILQRIKYMIHLSSIANELNSNLDDILTQAGLIVKAKQLKKNKNIFITFGELSLSVAAAKLITPSYGISFRIISDNEEELRNDIKEGKPVAVRVYQYGYNYNVVEVISLEALKNSLRKERAELNSDLDLVSTF